MENRLGNNLLIISIIMVLVMGSMKEQLGSTFIWIQSLLVILGFLAGIFSIQESKSKEFIIAVLSLVAVYFLASDLLKAWDSVFWLGDYLKGIFTSALVFLVPAAVSNLLVNVMRLLFHKPKEEKKQAK